MLRVSWACAEQDDWGHREHVAHSTAVKNIYHDWINLRHIVRVFPSLESVGRWGFIPSPLTVLCLFPVDPHSSICLEFTGPAAWLVGCSVIILLLMLLQKRSCFILIGTLAPFVKPFVKLVCIWTKSLEVQLKSMFLSSQVLCGCDFLSASIGRVSVYLS